MGFAETSLNDGLLTITLNNPPRNTLSMEVLRSLFALEEMLGQEEVQAIIITGVGRVFCAGADVDEMPLITSRRMLEIYSMKTHNFFETLSSFPKPIIAAMNGTCLGGGLELALACHFRIMASRGMIGLPEIELGLMPGWGGTQRLPRLVGEGVALDMILTGRTLRPDEALQNGLVHKVVPRKEVLAEAVSLARKLMRRDRQAISRALRATRAASQVPLTIGLEMERTFFAELWEKNMQSTATGETTAASSQKPSEKE